MNLPATTKFVPVSQPDSPATKDTKMLAIENTKPEHQPEKPLNTSATCKDQIDEIMMPKLKYIYKVPSVIWQQSDDLICLSISAPDINDYSLTVDCSSISFM